MHKSSLRLDITGIAGIAITTVIAASSRGSAVMDFY
jgi:hypothetical protein